MHLPQPLQLRTPLLVALLLLTIQPNLVLAAVPLGASLLLLLVVDS